MKLYIESHEGGIYLARIVNDNAATYVCHRGAGLQHQRPQKFASIGQIKEHFTGQSFDQVWLNQLSPYDEMIGLDKSAEGMLIPLSWAA